MCRQLNSEKVNSGFKNDTGKLHIILSLKPHNLSLTLTKVAQSNAGVNKQRTIACGVSDRGFAPTHPDYVIMTCMQ